jgi:hypothetical protein
LELCEIRAQLAKKIREVVWVTGYLQKIEGFDARDIEAGKIKIKQLISGEANGSYGPPSDGFKELFKYYLDYIDQYESLLQQLESLTKPLYETAQPSDHVIGLSLM